MRKPRDLDQELTSLIAKTKSLQERKLKQLGELVVATGAGDLDAETLAGGLLALIESATPERKESWRNRGRGFFQRRARETARQAPGNGGGAEAGNDSQAQAGREPSPS